MSDESDLVDQLKRLDFLDLMKIVGGALVGYAGYRVIKAWTHREDEE